MHTNLNQYINSNNHVYSTRNRDIVAPMFQRLAATQHSVSYSGPHIWNSLPQNFKNIQSFSTCKRELKLYFINQYTHWTYFVFLHSGKHFLHLSYYTYVSYIYYYSIIIIILCIVIIIVFIGRLCTLPELERLVSWALNRSSVIIFQI